ncbi:MAG: hypothetical protein IJ368_02565, partial [Oscillospiraceae bacterium]|nr:hypothetical protein [Oscillospiraceae bacterium]
LLFMMPTPAKGELHYEGPDITPIPIDEGISYDGPTETVTGYEVVLYYDPNNGYYDGRIEKEHYAVEVNEDVAALYDAERSKMHKYTVDESYKENKYYTQLDADYKKVYDDLYLWCDIIMRHKYDVVPATGNSYYVDYIYFTDEDFEDKKELATEFIKANPQFFFIESLEYDTSGRLWLKMYDGYENGEARVAEAERRVE